MCSMQFYFSRKKALFEILVLHKPRRNIALEYNVPGKCLQKKIMSEILSKDSVDSFATFEEKLDIAKEWFQSMYVRIHSGRKCLPRVACLWSKMPMFQRAGIRKGGKPLPLAFQYLISMEKRPCDLNLVMLSSLATKCQHFKLRGLQLHYIKWLKKEHFNFKVLAFEASEDIITKLKSRGLYTIKIKY